MKLFLTSAKTLLSENVIQVINLIKKKYFLFYIRPTEEEPKCTPAERVKGATEDGTEFVDAMLEFGPMKIIVGDLWTCIPPAEITAECAKLKDAGSLSDGWLHDSVSSD